MNKKEYKINYKPLWKIMIDKDISKSKLQNETSIAASTFTKMKKNEYVSLDVLVRISVVLECGLDELVEIEK